MARDRDERKRLLSEGRQFLGAMWKRRQIAASATRPGLSATES
jgi:hypothetical protein